MQRVITAGLTLLLLLAAAPTFGARLNIGLLDRRDNLDADITLTSVPRNMTTPGAEVTIRWAEEVTGVLRYSANYRGDSPADYPDSLAEPVRSDRGLLTFRGDQLPVGYLYCIIDARQAGYSVVFNVIIVADHAPRMVAPISAAGRQGINTVTPNFRWEAVNGVPFYHVVVSDQPFQINEDEEGNTKVEGANVIWQAITSQTSIQFGVADPSGTIDNDMTPPLVGSMNRDDRQRYNWIVLNNFGNNPAYSSTISGGVAGFEVEMEPPFGEPQNVAPQSRAQLSSREILFRWTEIDEAVSYFVYLSKEEITEGGSQALVPAWSAQTTLTSIACPAADVLTEGRYVWKVLAASRQGRGTFSDTTSFTYIVRSGEVRFVTYNEERNRLEFARVETVPLSGPALPTFGTNDQGEAIRDVPVGLYRFIASKEGFEDAMRDSFRVQEGGSYAISLYLNHIPTSIVGTTVDESNRAVGRVTVTATAVANGRETSVETNVSGEFQLIVDPGNYLINAQAAGRQSPEERAVNVREGTTLDLNANGGPLTLPTYRYRLAGYVRNANGQPISSSTVILLDENGQEQRVYTPEAGSYSFTVGSGTWRINATKPGFYLESGEVEVEITDRDQEVNFTLIPQAGVLSGQVSADGSPVNRNAEVWFIPDAGEVVTTTVNHIGAFSRGVAPGSYIVVAVRQGYHTEDSLDLTVEPGETISGLRLSLAGNPSSISGRITDNDGNTLREATVSASGVRVTSDANGNYRLGLAAGDHTIRATKSGYVTAERGPISISAGQNQTNVDLVLADNAGTISGRVRRGADPIIDAVVTATRDGQGGGATTTRTDREGRYSFGLSYGTYRITVQKDGFRAQDPAQLEVQLQPGQVVSDRNFTMQNYSGRIAGSVTSPLGGVNTPSLRAVALDDPNIVFSANGNVQGGFLLTATPERRYIVTASKTGFSTVSDTTARLEVEGEVQLSIQLQPLPCVISGAVSAQGGDPGGASIRADGNAGAFTATADRVGRYSLSLRPGQYRLSASKPGYTIAESDLNIQAGQDLGGIDFALQPAFASIGGVVRDQAGNSVAGADVIAVDSTANRLRTTTTDRDGAYQIGELIAGSYYVIATHPAHRRGSVNLGAIAARQERRGVNLELTRLAAAATGRVTAGGAAVSGATVFAREARGAEFSARTDNNGQYFIRNMSDGTFALRAAKAGYTSVQRANIAVDPADTVAVDLELILNDGRITGVIRDPDGAGLRDARVIAMDSLGNFASTNSNASGQFGLENLFPQSRYFVTMTLANYTPERDTIRNVNPGDNLTIRMTPNNLRLTGKTVNQIGNAISGTEILVTSLSDGTTFRGTSNQAGDVTVNGLAPNTRYRIETQRFEDYYANADTTVQLGANHIDIGSRIRLIQRTASVSGTAGVAGVTMEARNMFNGRVVQGFTDDQGRYRLVRLRGGDFGRFTVKARKEGYIVRQPDSVLVQNVELNEERRNVNFTLDRFVVSLSGVVRDSLGAAMIGCPVTAWSEVGTFTDSTDSSGAFAIEGAYPRAVYTLTTSLPSLGYENASRQIDVGEQSIRDITLTIQRHNKTLRGRVVNDRGGHVVSAAVLIDGTRPTTTNGSGYFTATYIPSGERRLRIIKDGYRTIDTLYNAGNGEGIDSLQFVLNPLELAIYGVAFQANVDYRIPQALARLISNAGDTLWDTTAVNGSYFFEHLNPDLTYDLRLTKRGFEDWDARGMSVASGSVARNPVMRARGAGVMGSVSDAGEFKSRAPVALLSMDNILRADTTDGFGDYFIAATPGAYILMATLAPPEKGGSFNQNITIPDGQPLKQQLVIESSGVVRGRLQLPDGRPPLTRGVLRAGNTNTGEGLFAMAAADGAVSISGLRPGDYRVVVDAVGYALGVGALPVSVSGGDTLELDLTLTQSGKAMTGFVVGPDSTGLARARIAIAGTTPAQLTTDTRGYWSLNGPMAGRYTISIFRNGYSSPPDTTFDLQANDILQFFHRIDPAPSMISGRAADLNGDPVRDAKITLLEGGTARDSVQTDRYGEYRFSGLAAGGYRIAITAAGYNSSPGAHELSIGAGGSAIDRDFRLTPIRGTAVIAGRVTHRGTNLARLAVTAIDVNTGERRGGLTDSSGAFYLRGVPTPGAYRITVENPGYPSVRTDPTPLQTNDSLHINLSFPHGQIVVRLLDPNDQPYLGRRVYFSGLGVDYNALIFSDANGVAATPDWLPPGRYSVVPQSLTGMLPPVPQEHTLGLNETDTLIWRLGWRFTPPPPFDQRDSGRVQIDVPAAVAVADANLFWRSPGAQLFQSTPLQRIGTPAPRRIVRDLNALPVAVVTGFDATVSYIGYIPPQGRSGTLTYYLQVNTADGQTFGGPESAQDVTITARGILDRVALTRSQSALPPRIGVPIELRLAGFDDGNVDLTENLKTTGTFVWTQVGEENGDLTVSTGDPTRAVYFAEETGPATIRVTAAQSASGVTASQTISWNNVETEIKQISISTTDFAIQAGDSIKFTVTAVDTGGSLAPINPLWRTSPVQLAALAPTPYTMDAWLVTHPNVLGRALISVKDSVSGVEAMFNDDSPDRSQWGLSVYGVASPGAVDTFRFSDGAGMKIEIPAAALAGRNTARIFLTEPLLSPVLRLTAEYELPPIGYNIKVEGSLLRNAGYRLTIPLQEGYPAPLPTVGVWDAGHVDWKVIEGNFNADTTAIEITVESLDGLYAIISASEPLGVRDLRFSPNPFSPHAAFDPGLSVEFRLTSDRSDYPVLTVKIYNMAGQLVRKLVDAKQSPKGQYGRGRENQVVWNGLTDDGLEARNGRYMVVVIAQDASGDAKEVGSAVLIK